MNELKKQYELLLRALVKEALGNSFDLQQLQGTAIYDNQKDSFIKSLAEFANVEKCIRGLAPIQAHYGVEQASRIALQLVYEYFAVRDAIGFDAALLENIWSNFVTELDTPVWRSRSIALNSLKKK